MKTHYLANAIVAISNVLFLFRFVLFKKSKWEAKLIMLTKKKRNLTTFLLWFCVDEINHRKCSFFFFFFKIADTRKSIHQDLEVISILYLRKRFEFEWAVCNQCNVYRFHLRQTKTKSTLSYQRNRKLNQDLPAVVVKQSEMISAVLSACKFTYACCLFVLFFFFLNYSSFSCMRNKSDLVYSVICFVFKKT